MMARWAWTGVAIVALAMTASAQRGGGGGRGGGGMGDSMPMTTVRLNRMDMLERVLSLNKDQRKDVKNVMDESQKEAAPVRDQMVKARAEVAAAVESGKADGVDQAVKSYADLQSKMAAIELKAFAQVYKLLDSDQQQKTRDVFPMVAGIFMGKNWTEVQP